MKRGAHGARARCRACCTEATGRRRRRSRSTRVRDIATNPKWKSITEGDAMLVHVIMPKAEEAPAPAEAAAAATATPAEPEVIKKGKKEEAEAEKEEKPKK